MFTTTITFPRNAPGPGGFGGPGLSNPFPSSSASGFEPVVPAQRVAEASGLGWKEVFQGLIKTGGETIIRKKLGPQPPQAEPLPVGQTAEPPRRLSPNTLLIAGLAAAGVVGVILLRR